MTSTPTTQPAPANRSSDARRLNSLQCAAFVAIAWSLGVVAVVAGRFRGELSAYRALHRWCAELGVPDWVRNLDSLILFGAAAMLGAGLVAWLRGGSTLANLRLHGGKGRWGWMVLVALLPMVIGGAILGWTRLTQGALNADTLAKLVGGVVRAPLAEELLFRGLLVGVSAIAVGWRGAGFWANATAAALLFALLHVPWTAKGIAEGWPTLLMTGAGGLWYAWLMARWGSLWVPIVLHAGMNLGWFLAGASGGAGGGGLIENILRAATIAIATWWTVRRTAGTPV